MRHLWVLLVVGLVAHLGSPAAAEGEKRPIDEVLRGRIVALDGDRISVEYDLSDPVQMEDWVVTKPFRVTGKLEAGYENEAVRIQGTGAWMHVMAFDADVEVSYDLKPWKDRDLGVIVTESAQNDQFVLFSVNDLYFQKWDGADRPGHMITRFGVKDGSLTAEWTAFRYIARGTMPEIRKFETIRVTASKKGHDDTLVIGDKTYSGVEMGRELLDLSLGLYVVDSNALVDEIVVTGKPSPRWLEARNAELSLSRPLDAEPEGPDKDAEARKVLEAFQGGQATLGDLLTVIADVEVGADVRTAAADAVEAAADKTVVPHLVPLLYSEDLDTRIHGERLVRKLVGKNFGYQPKAAADKRSAAIQKLIQHIQKNAAQFGVGR